MTRLENLIGVLINNPEFSH